MDIKMQIINGNGEYIKDGVEKTGPAAIKYYGDKYKDIIINTIEETLFYEWQDNQTKADVIYDLTGKEIDEESNDEDIGGAFLICEKNNDNYNLIVIYRNKYLEKSYHYLVHELFGHAVYSYINPIIYIDGIKYYRNGICYINTENKELYNQTLNEGFVEDATLNIMQLAHMKPRWLEHYFKSKQTASIIRRKIGHNTLYDGLIMDDNQISIENIYNEPSNWGEFQQLSKILDNDFNYKDNPNRNKLYNDNLRRFIKRRTKINK